MTDRKQLFAALLRTQFAPFAMKVFHTLEPGTPFKPNWHHDALAYQLERVRTGQVNRLVINAPPRTAKSIYASVALCAFIHGLDPTKKISCLSYSADLAGKLARDYRTIITSDWYRELFPGTRISPEKNSETEIVLTERGFRLAWSVTGTITGRGASLIIVDDPIKAEDAFSEVIRDSVNETFNGTVLTRLDDKVQAAIIVVMQRFHPEDLSGHVLAKGGWTHLSLPAIAECDALIPIGPGKFHTRRAGEALHPQRESIELLNSYRAAIGEMRYSAQFQQAPVPLEGNLIKWSWFETYDGVPDTNQGDEIIQSWDTAAKPGANNAFSACLTFLRREQHHYLLHVLRERLDYPALRRVVVAHAQTWRAGALLIEDAALGTALIQDLRADPSAPQPIAIRAEGDKVTRMAACTATIESRGVFLPNAAPWLDAFRIELLQFPHGAYKDQIDALSQYLNWSKNRASCDFECHWLF